MAWDLHTTGTLILVAGAVVCACIGAVLYFKEAQRTPPNKSWQILVLFVLLSLMMVIGALVFQDKLAGAMAAGFIGTIVGAVAASLGLRPGGRE